MNHYQTQDSPIAAYGALVCVQDSDFWSSAFDYLARLGGQVKAALTKQPKGGLYGCLVEV